MDLKYILVLVIKKLLLIVELFVIHIVRYWNILSIKLSTINIR